MQLFTPENSVTVAATTSDQEVSIPGVGPHYYIYNNSGQDAILNKGLRIPNGAYVVINLGRIVPTVRLASGSGNVFMTRGHGG
jgi:hypothetical protein